MVSPDKPRNPWHLADDEMKVHAHMDPAAEIIASLTPSRTRIRMGVLINGRETSVVVPLSVATNFLHEVQTLIDDKGEA